MDIDKIIARVTEQVLSELEAEGQIKNKYSTPLEDIPSKFEHSLLNPDTTLDKIIKGCAEARQYRLANVCVNPYLVPFAAQQLSGSGVGICSVVGFPHGAASSAAKITEIRECISAGATELDISLNIVAIKSGRMDDARKDLDLMVSANNGRIKLKAIYEQGVFTDSEKEKALLLIRSSGVDFVKISNALTGKKAAEEDCRFVRGIVGRGLGIKIDGGVKTLEKALSLFEAGATRIGLTSALAICDEAKKEMQK